MQNNSKTGCVLFKKYVTHNALTKVKHFLGFSDKKKNSLIEILAAC